MARREYSEEFGNEAVKQVTENDYSIAETAERLGIHPNIIKSLDKTIRVARSY